MLAALAGRPPDGMPVAVPYPQLYYLDHFTELTGLPQMQSFAWRVMEPDAHTALLGRMVAQADFDILWPAGSPSRAERASLAYTERGGRWFETDRRTRRTTELRPRSGHAYDDTANQMQYVHSIAEARRVVRLYTAEQGLADGLNDYPEALARAFGAEHCIIAGGVVGAWYGCVPYVGLQNLFYLAAEQPALITYLCERALENNLETIRRLARAGGDAVYIDDATMTGELVSPAYYERFSLPYTRRMVEEIHRHGLKALVIYFGAVMDRLDLIAETGADALQMETSMKGYTNDIAATAQRIGGRMTLCGNIDPIGVLQHGTDAELAAEVARQAQAGRLARGFILSTGSPLTPATPLSRVRRFLELGRAQPAACSGVPMR